MTIAEAKKVMQAYRDRENGIDFAIKIIDMAEETTKPKTERKPKEKPQPKEKPNKKGRTCPICNREFIPRGRQKICSDCKKQGEQSDEMDIKITAHELVEMQEK